MEKLIVESSSFQNNDFMSDKYTGFGEDISPEIRLPNLCDNAVSIAIIMDDLDIPFVPEFNHWLIWNIPKQTIIPERFSTFGAEGAVQGVAWGKNIYRGPKQPIFIRKTHRYIFNVYVLDCLLDLKATSKKADLLSAMQGHILQQGSITGKYKRKK